MQKPAPVDYDVLEPIRERWSPYAFDREKPVEPAKLLSCFEAARWAASSQNEQPWAFVAGDRDNAPESWRTLFGLLVDGNKTWAKNAPVLILSVVRLHFEKDGKVNPTALHCVGLAVQNFVLQSVALGLSVHQMGGYDREKAREVLGIPDTHAPVAVIALGYEAPSGSLDDPKLRDRNDNPERTRKPLKEFVYSGASGWGESSPLVEPPK
ncbi:MAG: nitroreductase family protein [Akkermansiaceae bacterium]|nr:nitroreductase family protein [Armatimonadota bacterium]